MTQNAVKYTYIYAVIFFKVGTYTYKHKIKYNLQYSIVMFFLFFKFRSIHVNTINHSST